MKKFLLFLFVFFLVVGCSTKKTPPEMKTSPSSLKKIEGPNVSMKEADTTGYILLINTMIGFVNGFAEGTYNFAASLNNLKEEMEDYKYSNGTWTWEVSSGMYTVKITCTQIPGGYEWKLYINDELIYLGYIESDGSHAYWKYYYSGNVIGSFEWEDNGSGGYFKFYQGDLGENIYLSISWVTTSSYCEVVIDAIGYSTYKYTIRGYNDHSGFANIVANNQTIFSVQWDSNGNIVK